MINLAVNARDVMPNGGNCSVDEDLQASDIEELIEAESEPRTGRSRRVSTQVWECPGNP